MSKSTMKLRETTAVVSWLTVTMFAVFISMDKSVSNETGLALVVLCPLVVVLVAYRALKKNRDSVILEYDALNNLLPALRAANLKLSEDLEKLVIEKSEVERALQDANAEYSELNTALQKIQGDVRATSEESFLQGRINYLISHDIPQATSEFQQSLKAALDIWKKDLDQVMCLWTIANEAKTFLRETQQDRVLAFEYRPVVEHYRIVQDEVKSRKAGREGHNLRGVIAINPIENGCALWCARLNELHFRTIVKYLLNNAVKHGSNIILEVCIDPKPTPRACLIVSNKIREGDEISQLVAAINGIIETPKVKLRSDETGTGGTFLLARLAALSVGGSFRCQAEGNDRIAIRYEVDAQPIAHDP